MAATIKRCAHARCNTPAIERSNYCSAHQLQLSPRGTRGEKFVIVISIVAGLLLAALINALNLL